MCELYAMWVNLNKTLQEKKMQKNHSFWFQVINLAVYMKKLLWNSLISILFCPVHPCIFFCLWGPSICYRCGKQQCGGSGLLGWLEVGQGQSWIHPYTSLVQILARVWHNAEGVWLGRTFEIYPLKLGKETVQQNLTISKITTKNQGWADEPKLTHKWV